MKIIKLFVVLSLLFVVEPALAQDDSPQKVHSIVYIRKSFEWYTNQYALWEKELNKNKKNPEAWMNKLTAARMAKLTSPDAEKREQWKNTENAGFEGFEKNIKGTYEFWVLKRWQAFIEWDDVDDPDELKKRRDKIQEYCLNAYKLDPSRYDVYGNLMNFYIEEGNDAKAREIALRWMDSGSITYSLYALSHNMLASCGDNAVIFTQGDNDTYPAWVLQNAKDFRNDVTVINIWLAHSSREYRNTVFTKAGLPLMPENPEEKQAIIDHVIDNSGETEILFTPGFDLHAYDSLAENVYSVGAALVYSEHYFNNTSYLIDNFENNYLLDQLNYGIQYESWPEKAKESNFNYISGLFHLLNHYVVTCEGNKVDATKKMINNIIEGTEYEEEISNHLKSYDE